MRVDTWIDGKQTDHHLLASGLQNFTSLLKCCKNTRVDTRRIHRGCELVGAFYLFFVKESGILQTRLGR